MTSKPTTGNQPAQPSATASFTTPAKPASPYDGMEQVFVGWGGPNDRPSSDTSDMSGYAWVPKQSAPSSRP